MYKMQALVTRPNDIVAYGAGDVVGTAFQLVGAPSATLLRVVAAALRMDVAAPPAGMGAFRLQLYSAAPPSAFADNAVWDLSAGDRAIYEGPVDIPMPVDVGATLFSKANMAEIILPGTGLWAYLVTVAAHTPVALQTFAPALYAVNAAN